MSNTCKYGLFEYDTENIGDEVQSIAARRFLPQIDYYFNRDNIDATTTKSNETIKLIMNGWYTHHPENWPPKNPCIDPLLIAMHIEQDALDGTPAKAFLSTSSKSFLKKFGPVGARNYPTHNLLKQNNIDSYFSGCITLTLIPDQQIEKQKFILAVDVPDEVYSTMLKQTTRPIYRLNTNHKKNLDRETKFLLAELWLYLYQSAHAVITTRLHTMLPCLAFKTPVLAITGRDPKRYKGLIELTNHSTADDYIKNPSIFNLNHPPRNPKDYLLIRKQLEKTCSNYTNYDSKKSFLNGKTPHELLHNTKIIQFFLSATFETWALEETTKQIVHLQDSAQSQNKHDVQQVSNLGIKESATSLMRAIKRRILR